MPEFTPGIEVDVDGNERYVIDGGQYVGTRPTFNSDDLVPYEIDELTGQKIYENIVDSEDPQFLRDSQASEYRGLIEQEYGAPLLEATAWANQIWTQEETARFNVEFGSDDPDRMHIAVQQLLDQYQLLGDIQTEEPETEEESAVQQWFDELPDELFNSEVESVINREYSVDEAETMADIAQSFEHGSVEHSILSAGVDIAFGKADTESVIRQLSDRYGMPAVAAAYLELQEAINP